MNNGLFKPKSRQELDKLIKDRLGQGSLVTEMETEEKKKSAVQEGRLLQWSDEWKKYPYLYIFLAVSALFTLTLGMFMGIAPKMNALDNTVFYHTDPLHLFLAFVYMTAFVSITEGAFAIAKWLFHTRENGNKTQENTMLVMMGIAGISIVGTGIAGGMVVASNIAFLSAFIEIPASAQRWVIVIIPILLAVYAFLLTAYSLSSARAKSERMLNQMNHKSTLDHQTRQRGIMQIAEEELQVTELNLYMQMVADGKMSAAQATAAIKAGRTLGQEEIRQGRDIDGGGIGVTSTTSSQTRQPRPEPTTNITLDEFMQFQKKYQGRNDFSVVELGEVFSKIGSCDDCFRSFRNNQGLPSGMTRANFENIYNQVMLLMPVPSLPNPHGNGNGQRPQNPS